MTHCHSQDAWTYHQEPTAGHGIKVLSKTNTDPDPASRGNKLYLHASEFSFFRVTGISRKLYQMKASMLFPAVFYPQRNSMEIKHAVLIQLFTGHFISLFLLLFFKQSRMFVVDINILLTRILFISQLLLKPKRYWKV